MGERGNFADQGSLFGGFLGLHIYSGSEISVSKVAHSRDNVFVIIKLWVYSRSDNSDIRILLLESIQTIRA